jgi:hypothetical protein
MGCRLPPKGEGNIQTGLVFKTLPPPTALGNPIWEWERAGLREEGRINKSLIFAKNCLR